MKESPHYWVGSHDDETGIPLYCIGWVDINVHLPCWWWNSHSSISIEWVDINVHLPSWFISWWIHDLELPYWAKTNHSYKHRFVFIMIHFFPLWILLDLESVLEAGYTPSPNFELLHSVADYKSIIEPVVADVHGHTKPLCFRFLKDNSGHAQLNYRFKTSDKKWLPDNDSTLHLLTVISLLL